MILANLFGNDLSINENPVLAGAKRGEKQWKHLFHNDLGTIDYTFRGLDKFYWKMSEGIEDAVEGDFALVSDDHCSPGKLVALQADRLSLDCEIDSHQIIDELKRLVPRARLELACLSTLVPKTSASTNFATSALLSKQQIKI